MNNTFTMSLLFLFPAYLNAVKKKKILRALINLKEMVHIQND